VGIGLLCPIVVALYIAAVFLFFRGKFLELGEKEKEAAKGTKGFFCFGGGKCPQVNHIVRKTILSFSHLDAEVMASKQSEIKFLKRNLSYLTSSQIWLFNVVGSYKPTYRFEKKSIL
jgi:hypothetical protein